MVEFRCYFCPQGFYDYGSLENHFVQNHPEEKLDQEKVYLGNTGITAPMLKQKGRRFVRGDKVSKNPTPKKVEVIDVEMKKDDTTKKIKAFQCIFCPKVLRYKKNIQQHCKEV